MIKCTDEKKQLYFVQIKVKDPITGNWKTKKKRGIQGKRNAQAEERQMMIDASSATTADSFRAIWHFWENAGQASAEMKRHYKEHFEIRFKDYLDEPIEKITRTQLTGWRVELAQMDFATKTKNMTITYVKSVFRFAAETYGIKNPATVLRSFKRSNDEVMTEMKVWSPEEYSAFRSAVDNPLYAMFFDTLFWTGMRRGEAIALQKEDFTDGWLNVRASQRTMKEGRKPTKTKQRRNVQIDSVLNDELKPLLKEPGNYLFGGETALGPTAIDSHFRKAIKKSGVSPIRLHDLRHSHATWLINQGVNIVAVSRRLGHSSIEQTLQTYTHLLKGTEERLMEEIENAKKK